MRTRIQPIDFRVERDLGQKINATFGFIRQNVKNLLTCLLYFVIPFALVAGIFAGFFQTQLKNGFGLDAAEAGSWSVVSSMFGSNYYWLQLLFTLGSVVMLSVTVYVYMVQYMQDRRQPEVKEVWEGIKVHFLPLLMASIGFMILWLLASVLLVLPGIYVMVAGSLMLFIMVFEDLGFGDALKRSFYLVKDEWWPTFGFIIVITLIQALIAFVASVPTVVLTVMNTFVPGSTNDITLVIAQAFGTFIQLLMYVITIVGLVFQYFTLVEKKEGIGYLEKVNEIGQRQPLYPLTEQEEA